MKSKHLLLMCLGMLINVSEHFAQTKQWAYTGQEPPGLTPELFAPDFISTDRHEFSCAFSPDGGDIYFTRRVKEFDRNRIMVTSVKDGKWQDPIIAPKAGDYEGMEPFISPDGSIFLFQTWRPVHDTTRPSMDIWMMQYKDQEWGDPVHLEHPFNPMRSMYFSMSNKEKLYTTDISGGMGTGSIVYVEYDGHKFSEFNILSPIINSTGKEIYPCIAYDESYLLFTRREDNSQSGIYVTFRIKNGDWNEPQKLDLGLENVSMPRLSPDGKYLFFTGMKERLQGDIYWVDAKIIQAFNPQETN